MFIIVHYFGHYFRHVRIRNELSSSPLIIGLVFSETLDLYLKSLTQILFGVITVLRTRSPKLAIHRFARDLKNHPSGSPWPMLKESASHYRVLQL